jgi:hypothetical protein
MIQPKKRVTAIPEMGGMRMAKIPASRSRTLRAMDQLRALETGDARGAVLLMMSPPKDVDCKASDMRENSR